MHRRANSSPGQYLVVDQSLGQRFPVNSNSKAFPYFVGSNQQPPFNLLPSGGLINANQLNSSLNGNSSNNVAALNTQQLEQQKGKAAPFHPSQLAGSNPSAPFYPHLSGVSEPLPSAARAPERPARLTNRSSLSQMDGNRADLMQLNSIQREIEHQQLMNAKRLLRPSLNDLNNPAAPLAYFNHLEKYVFRPHGGPVPLTGRVANQPSLPPAGRNSN